MPDESGGDFGGGSVTWRVTSGKEKGGGNPKPGKPHGSKFRFGGEDQDATADGHFLIKLHRLKELTASELADLVKSLRDAADEAETGAPKTKVGLKRKGKLEVEGEWLPQIQVVWKDHVDTPLGTST